METELKVRLDDAWYFYIVAKSEADYAYKKYQRLSKYADDKFKDIELISEQLDKLEGEKA
jgi:hypothetical protein